MILAASGFSPLHSLPVKSWLPLQGAVIVDELRLAGMLLEKYDWIIQ
jgi:hypothetical protein